MIRNIWRFPWGLCWLLFLAIEPQTAFAQSVTAPPLLNMETHRAPDGSILPSERSPAERLGCGTGHNCFFVVPMSAAERETLRHSLWANDERRDDYLRARRARILREMEQDGFAVFDATEHGWVRRDDVVAYSFTLPEFILNAVVASNARYCNPPQPEPPSEEIAASKFLCNGGKERAAALFQKLDAIKMGGM